jgi:hypothetical protein
VRALSVFGEVVTNRLGGPGIGPGTDALGSLLNATTAPDLSVRAGAVLYLDGISERSGLWWTLLPRDCNAACDVFVKPVPEALQREIEQIVARVSAHSPLSAEEREHATAALRSLDLTYQLSSRETNDAARKYFRELGLRAVPLLAQDLVDADSNVRRKAMWAMSFLLRPKEMMYPGYEETEAALLTLADRSALDSSSSVRISAIGTLTSIARQRWRNLPSRALDALRSAADDPEYRVKRAAVNDLVYLGQIEGVHKGFGYTSIVD